VHERPVLAPVGPPHQAQHSLGRQAQPEVLPRRWECSVTDLLSSVSLGERKAGNADKNPLTNAESIVEKMQTERLGVAYPAQQQRRRTYSSGKGLQTRASSAAKDPTRSPRTMVWW
jgi:hypothetical protein